jgi:hypothetical protein
MIAGLGLLVATLAGELWAAERSWLLPLAFVAWCVTAFGFGMFYRDFIRRLRERRRRGTGNG